jgi:hypothetical protein
VDAETSGCGVRDSSPIRFPSIVDVATCTRRRRRRDPVDRSAKTAEHLLATRTGIVYPLELPPATMSAGRHSRPFRVAHSAGYRQSKAALDSGAMLPEVPSLATLALTTTPTVSTNFTGLAFPDSQCGPDCEPPDTQVAAGPNDIIEATNIVFEVFDKSGNSLHAPGNLNALFNVNVDIFSSDPRVEYDTIFRAMVHFVSDSRQYRRIEFLERLF